ncbi:MAG: hypothetical protein A2Y62_13990 [Candidatus Fischerbacteria bacterium RBG_13_37_8]|uniref:Peptidase M48 domain-containing protein n=1 Tax=Candidatus Fischerbacteria bacterium RBG_13_37_8 TaxID=1817863 RepID=A0A1F5VFN9_9BACT|nr:MAG: hypothetical protein A2Y62_13990 [Candidatus Fischerbacteria bacterium RBG_13_37_8]
MFKSSQNKNYYILFYHAAVLLIALGLLVGCTKPVVYHGKEVGGGMNFLSIDDEVSLGRQVAEEIEATMPMLQDYDIHDYINDIGYTLELTAKNAGFPQFNYQFQVVNDDVINAFALPGGYIYIHRGLLHQIENESEIAGVLAHEMGHVIGHHGAEIWSKMILLSGIIIAATESIPDKHKKWKTVAQIGGGFALVFTQLKYSRDAEREADFIGVHLLREAGYNPEGMVTLFQKFDKMNKSSPSAFQTFFSSHPTPAERIKNTEKEINSINDKSMLVTTTKNFSEMKSELEKLPPPPKKKK